MSIRNTIKAIIELLRYGHAEEYVRVKKLSHPDDPPTLKPSYFLIPLVAPKSGNYWDKGGVCEPFLVWADWRATLPCTNGETTPNEARAAKGLPPINS